LKKAICCLLIIIIIIAAVVFWGYNDQKNKLKQIDINLKKASLEFTKGNMNNAKSAYNLALQESGELDAVYTLPQIKKEKEKRLEDFRAKFLKIYKEKLAVIRKKMRNGKRKEVTALLIQFPVRFKSTEAFADSCFKKEKDAILDENRQKVIQIFRDHLSKAQKLVKSKEYKKAAKLINSSISNIEELGQLSIFKGAKSEMEKVSDEYKKLMENIELMQWKIISLKCPTSISGTTTPGGSYFPKTGYCFIELKVKAPVKAFVIFEGYKDKIINPATGRSSGRGAYCRKMNFNASEHFIIDDKSGKYSGSLISTGSSGIYCPGVETTDFDHKYRKGISKKVKFDKFVEYSIVFIVPRNKMGKKFEYKFVTGPELPVQ